MGWKCITKPPVGKAKFPKGHVPRYMISRAFIPPWSLVMRSRKLSDQTLPLKAAGTLVSLLERFLTKYYFAISKSRFLKTRKRRCARMPTIRLRDEIPIARAWMP